MTRQRMYLETMQTALLEHQRKIMIDAKGQGNLLYLPLDKLMNAGGDEHAGRGHQYRFRRRRPVRRPRGVERCATPDGARTDGRARWFLFLRRTRASDSSAFAVIGSPADEQQPFVCRVYTRRAAGPDGAVDSSLSISVSLRSFSSWARSRKSSRAGLASKWPMIQNVRYFDPPMLTMDTPNRKALHHLGKEERAGRFFRQVADRRSEALLRFR